MFFSKNLKYLIENSEYSQNAIAKALEIDNKNLRKYKNGLTENPQANTLIKISEFFNVSVDALLKKDLSQD